MSKCDRPVGNQRSICSVSSEKLREQKQASKSMSMSKFVTGLENVTGFPRGKSSLLEGNTLLMNRYTHISMSQCDGVRSSRRPCLWACSCSKISSSPGSAHATKAPMASDTAKRMAPKRGGMEGSRSPKRRKQQTQAQTNEALSS